MGDEYACPHCGAMNPERAGYLRITCHVCGGQYEAKHLVSSTSIAELAAWTTPSKETLDILSRQTLPEPGTLVSRVVLEKEMARFWMRESALLAVVRKVAEADNSDHSVCYQLCSYDMHWTDDEHQVMTHNAPCVVEQARALLASAEADAAAQGEA